MTEDPSGPHDSDLAELLAELSEDFAQRHRRGERPSVETYAQQHPAVADQIRELFPALLVIEKSGIEIGAADPSREKIGSLIGPYKLLERLGEGGFGVVFMAEQQQPVRRKVALKVIKPGLDTAQVIARFEAERQALALMDHQNIAKVLDAGATSLGRPYFVMELVKGIPITDFCDQNRLATTDRLELFIQVCRAVQHAHSKGVIHRDIKPTNVLVTLHDGAPTPKVIDFGVAKAIGAQPLTDRTLFTQFAQIVGTPLYMSPEQAALSNVDADTRSDVYSLGVLLYELLTGTTPFDKDRLKLAAMEEVKRIIREEEPPKPSTRLTTMGNNVASVSSYRNTDPKRLSQIVRGELDWIVMKAMEKDRNRRYESTSALAADIRSYLANETISAAAPSWRYQLQKFVRRNTRLVLASGLLLFVLIAGMIGTTIGLLGQAHQRAVAGRERAEAVRQRDLAQARFDDVRKLANTLLFDVYRKIRDLPGSTPARELILSTAFEYLNKLTSQAGNDRELLADIGDAYFGLGTLQRSTLSKTQDALQSFRESLRIRQRLAEADPNDGRIQEALSGSYEGIGDVFDQLGDTNEALKAYRQCMDIRQKLLARAPNKILYQRLTALMHSRIGVMLGKQGDHEGALASLREALSIRQAIVAADPASALSEREVVHSHGEIGDVLVDVNDKPAALESYRSMLRIVQPLTEANPNDTTNFRLLSRSHRKIGRILARDADYHGALVEYRKALETDRFLAEADPTNREDQRDFSITLENVAEMLALSGDPASALPEYARVRAIREKIAAEDPSNLRAQRDLSVIYIKMANAMAAVGDASGALEIRRQALAIRQKLAEADPKSATAQMDVFHSLGKVADSFAQLAEESAKTPAVAIEHWREARDWYRKQSNLAESLKSRGLFTPSYTKILNGIPAEIARCDSALRALGAN